MDDQTSSPKALNIPMQVGLAMLALVAFSDVTGLSDMAAWSRIPRIILSLGGVGLLGWGFVRWIRRERNFDERFLIHRLKASRAALVGGMLTTVSFLAYDLVNKGTQATWQLITVLAVMGLTKVGAMVYYRRTE